MAKVTTPPPAHARQKARAPHIEYTERTTQPQARYRSTLPRRPFGRYKQAAESMRLAGIAWNRLDAIDRHEWNTTAAALRAASRMPIIDTRTGAPRFGKRFTAVGFSLFAAEFARLQNTTPKTPNDPTRAEPIEMTELLTGSTYEQRIIHALANTDGDLTIAMYQVSPTWEPTSIPASPLMLALLAQPPRRPTCRLILSTPDGAGNLAMLNDLAALLMTDAGWQVRRANAYPVLHAKLWLIEPGTVYAGSHNLSNRATSSNFEAGIITTSASVVADARTFLESRWNAAT